MRATTSTALALLLGLGSALPAAAAQQGADADVDGWLTADDDVDGWLTADDEAVARGGQGFQEVAGGEEDTREQLPDAAAGPRDAGAPARQEVQPRTEPAIEAQAEQPREPQPVLGGAGAGQGQTAVSAVVAPGARTEALEIALTEETLQATYFTDADWVGLDGNNLALSLLLSDDRDIVGSAAVLAPGLLGNALPEALSVSFGGKAYAALLDEPDDDVFALAPGVEGRYALPAVLGTPSFVVGNIFYAPDIVTFGEADDVVDFNVRYELQFTQRLLGFVGYRLLAFDRDEGEDDVVENLQVGVRFAF